MLDTYRNMHIFWWIDLFIIIQYLSFILWQILTEIIFLQVQPPLLSTTNSTEYIFSYFYFVIIC